MNAIIIVTIICITIIVLVYMTRYKSSRKVVKVISVKDKSLKFDIVQINVYSDGTLKLEYYDFDDDGHGY